MPVELHYIRKIILITEFVRHEEDIQSDMAFMIKQIVGFYEFELAAVDRISDTSNYK